MPARSASPGAEAGSWKPWKWPLDRIIALLAFLVSFAALGLAWRQTHLDYEHRKLSVRPRIYISFDYNNTGPNIGAGWHLRNTGLGPAEIRSFAVVVDDITQSTWTTTFKALGLPPVQYDQMMLHPGDFKIAQEPDTTLVWLRGPAMQQLKAESRRVRIEVCYCSMYEECWTISNVFGSLRAARCELQRTKIFHADIN